MFENICYTSNNYQTLLTMEVEFSKADDTKIFSVDEVEKLVLSYLESGKLYELYKEFSDYKTLVLANLEELNSNPAFQVTLAQLLKYRFLNNKDASTYLFVFGSFDAITPLKAFIDFNCKKVEV